MDNEREKRFAVYILEALQELNEAASDANAVPMQRSLIAAIVSELNDYRAESEPTADDAETASKIQISGRTPRQIRFDIVAALSAARGNRAELEAAAGEDNAALALCWDTFSRRITLDRRRECLTALQNVKADEVFYQEYEGDRRKVIAAILEVKE